LAEREELHVGGRAELAHGESGEEGELVGRLADRLERERRLPLRVSAETRHHRRRRETDPRWRRSRLPWPVKASRRRCASARGATSMLGPSVVARELLAELPQ